jgi:hypothetical protein
MLKTIRVKSYQAVIANDFTGIILYPNNDKIWYVEGKEHRIDGPAIMDANGDRYWYQNGRHHRLDGPAIECANGFRSFWIEDIEFEEKTYWEHIKTKSNKG